MRHSSSSRSGVDANDERAASPSALDRRGARPQPGVRGVACPGRAAAHAPRLRDPGRHRPPRAQPARGGARGHPRHPRPARYAGDGRGGRSPAGDLSAHRHRAAPRRRGRVGGGGARRRTRRGRGGIAPCGPRLGPGVGHGARAAVAGACRRGRKPRARDRSGRHGHRCRVALRRRCAGAGRARPCRTPLAHSGGHGCGGRLALRLRAAARGAQPALRC